MTIRLESEVPSVVQEARTPFPVPIWQSLDLFIAHFASQRTGNTIHSPKNGLAAAGWSPLQSSRIRLSRLQTAMDRGETVDAAMRRMLSLSDRVLAWLDDCIPR